MALGPRTLVMGVINVTPDSFSDGGLALDPERAAAIAVAMEAAGADLIDIGAESTRPGAIPVGTADEMARIRPVLRALATRVRVPISIDTYKTEVAELALGEGASIVNDISGLQYDPRLAALTAAKGAPIVLMHTRGRPKDMYAHAAYDDVVGEVMADLQRAVERAMAAGIARDVILVDPGLGFAKHASQSLAVLAALHRLAELGLPLLVGPSRKSFMAASTGPLDPETRDWPTAAAVTAAVLGGAHIVRVHRVAEMVHVVRVADAIRAASGV
jgi:dihydropteroate synthase